MGRGMILPIRGIGNQIAAATLASIELAKLQSPRRLVLNIEVLPDQPHRSLDRTKGRSISKRVSLTSHRASGQRGGRVQKSKLARGFRACGFRLAHLIVWIDVTPLMLAVLAVIPLNTIVGIAVAATPTWNQIGMLDLFATFLVLFHDFHAAQAATGIAIQLGIA